MLQAPKPALHFGPLSNSALNSRSSNGYIQSHARSKTSDVSLPLKTGLLPAASPKENLDCKTQDTLASHWSEEKDRGLKGAMSGVYDSYNPAPNGVFYDRFSLGSDADANYHSVDPKHYNTLAHLHNKIGQSNPEPASSTGSRAPSPVLFEQPAGAEGKAPSRHPSHHAVASYLQLPLEISNGRKGSLAEFTAEITCLFWFESAATLATVENAPHCPSPPTKLAPDAMPTTGFLKWVTTILTTTQVSTSVVLLAVLFILRLKKQNPTVNGKVGSEYRLLTVALMLGNKFLDDNTYTNKTWAEVSGIDVKEIHVMEVEFLSHMKYNLYTSKEEWKGWYQQLNKFWTYQYLAQRKSYDTYSRSSVQRPPTLSIPWALPSPPASSTESPSYGSGPSPENSFPGKMSAFPPHVIPSSVSESGSMSARKRSWDEVDQEPLAKRQHVLPPARQQHTPLKSTRAEPLPSLQSLPFPQLPAPTTQDVRNRAYSTQEGFTPQSLPQLQNLPPSGRNTPSSSYLPPANWLQGLPQPSSHRPSNAMAYALSTSNGSAYPSRHQTPTTSFQNMNPFDNQPQHSPSHYLNKRPSPYRPVQHMSQLTEAPPSRDMYEYPAQVSNDQMQWQPLKKNVEDNERRTGTVPYYQDPFPWIPMPSYENDSTQYAPYIGPR